MAFGLLAFGGWAAAALLLAGSDAGLWRRVLAAAMTAVAIAAAASILLRGVGWRGLALVAAPMLAVLAWYATLQPRGDRNWTPDVALAPWAEIDGDKVTVHEVR